MIARARPLLGTLVSIRARGDANAVNAAFSEIEKVQRLMSAHAEDSDVARVNRDAHRRPVRVHPWTFRVLSSARTMSAASEGAFDITVGQARADYRDVELLAGRLVRLRRQARVDLGGIAKGFAVDRAVGVLLRLGASSGSVNAGGDLRFFGDAASSVRLRLPGAPHTCVLLPEARNRAFATSAGYFKNEVRDARTGQALCTDSSITVSAASCMTADALTKAVAALGPLPALLRRFGASAYFLNSDGALYAARG